MTRLTGRSGNHSPRFDGVCTLCGWLGEFVLAGDAPGRVARDFRCGGCSAPLVYQAEASAILDIFGRGRLLCLDELVHQDDFRARSVFNVGHAGPVRNRLKKVDDYSESCFTEDSPLGQPIEGHPNRTNQDHERLTFADERFDLMVSSHILEHVPHPHAALSEAFRTLKPGGRYVFSIPGSLARPRSRTRAEVREGRIVHHEPARHHNSPEGTPALVFTDFGCDLLDTLEGIGFVAFVSRSHRSIQVAREHCIIVAIKPTC